MTLEEVEDIVEEAVKYLPEEFSSKLDNVGFVVANVQQVLLLLFWLLESEASIFA